MSKTRSLKNVETVERERGTLYSTWKMSTRPHTQVIY